MVEKRFSGKIRVRKNFEKNFKYQNLEKKFFLTIF